MRLLLKEGMANYLGGRNNLKICSLRSLEIGRDFDMLYLLTTCLLISKLYGTWASHEIIEPFTSPLNSSFNHNTMASGAAAVFSRMGNLRMVYVTAPSKEAALKIARIAVERKLAACANIIPEITSIYEWEGKVHEDAEAILIMKTQESLLEDLHKIEGNSHGEVLENRVVHCISTSNSVNYDC
ncbi:unnamed protein product [Strongylus vulgaris]|uniref:Uncharacterized protein n=1 Tax=Strongylus vulgaris TaxID=40348 RepID=A0A3P7J6H8_STRVU|nr:unnamed protein product [Strongylus vulgaris]